MIDDSDLEAQVRALIRARAAVTADEVLARSAQTAPIDRSIGDRAGRTPTHSRRVGVRGRSGLPSRRAAIAWAAAVTVLVLGSVVGTAVWTSSNPTHRATSKGKTNPRPVVTRDNTSTTQPGDCNCGVLQQFSPESATTWWAIVESNLTPKAFLVRTTDSGAHWKDLLTDDGQMNGYFLNGEVGWIAEGADLYRTVDGGASWERMGEVARNGCQMDFVDMVHGWCSEIEAALGSSGVMLYRTSDGGVTWTLVSETTVDGMGPSSPDSLPFACDKGITFTSTTVGWANGECNGGTAYLYKTDDAGSEWFKLPTPTAPPGAETDDGGGLGTPTVDGSSIAARLDVGEDISIVTSSDGGQQWRTQPIGGYPEEWTIDLIDPDDWIVTNGKVLKATEDSGMHWATWTPSVSMGSVEGSYDVPLILDFISPALGWAYPDSSSGPSWWTQDGGRTWKPLVIGAGPYKVD
jgi:photosystem II stability/assembly factor-like uncharacterized protein